METVSNAPPKVDVEALLKENIQLKGYNENYRLEIERLKEQVAFLIQSRFGSKSEKIDYDDRQLKLIGLSFDEAEELAAPEEDEVEIVPEHTRRKSGGRRKLPENLPHETVVHDLTDEEKLPTTFGL